MKILILGSEGYIGRPLLVHLLNKGHKVAGVDSQIRRERVRELGSDSLTPVEYTPGCSLFHLGSVNAGVRVKNLLHDFKPDTIVHLAEQPSAAWSMESEYHAEQTQRDNVLGTLQLLWAMKDECPKAHLIKLGSMGEYGTPNCEIPEGVIPTKPCYWTKSYEDTEFLKAACPMRGLLFPRTPGSFYHLSKVHDTYNIEFACRNWGLRSTDIMQGIVYGLSDECLTRFDYDECFGTVINRFCVEAIIGEPLTIYGKGFQKRGFLTLADSIKCLTIAIENPPDQGEYRTFNQFQSVWSINAISEMVCFALKDRRYPVNHYPNPRLENEDNYYQPEHRALINLGYEPDTDIEGNISKLVHQISPYKDRVIREVILPKINWRR